jgi:hypothetical protein
VRAEVEEALAVVLQETRKRVMDAVPEEVLQEMKRKIMVVVQDVA